MLTKSELTRLIDMQHRSYLLLKWMAKAVSEGFVNVEAAHNHATLPEAAEAWILRHYLNIPGDTRPVREDLPAFAAFFSTYLTNSFDLITEPGKQLYSPGGHCFCPWCSWLIDAPNLKPKKLTATDKRIAQRMRISALLALASEHHISARKDQIEASLHDRQVFEDASLLAYAYDLPQRERGIANGAGVLALWRGFAWNESGSPKQKFQLKPELIIGAETRLVTLLQRLGQV